MNMAPERGYDTAKAMLKQQFGEDYFVSASYMEKGAWMAYDQVRRYHSSSRLFTLFTWLLQCNGRSTVHARTRHANKHESSNFKASI